MMINQDDGETAGHSNAAGQSTISGTAMVVGLLALALALALFAWFYARSGDRRAQQAWGTERAALIVAATTAELWTLSADSTQESDAGAVERMEVDGQTLAIIARHDIAAARGVLHLRRGLIDDTSFDWDRADNDCEPQWTHVLSFAEGDEVVTLLVSLDCPRVRLVETGHELSTRPIAAAVREFVDEQVGTTAVGK